VLYRSITLEKH